MNAIAAVDRDGDAGWRVSGVLDVSSVAAVHEASRALWSAAPSLAIDLSGVTRIDSAALALLIEWQREAERRKCRLVISNVPPALGSMADLCGVGELLPSLAAGS